MSSVLHALVIAAVFAVYMGGMAGLFAYIARTGRERSAEPEWSEGEHDPEPAALSLAALGFSRDI